MENAWKNTLQNPFFEEGTLGVNASINKLVIEKLPFDIKDNIAGKTAMDIFSTKKFIDDIKEHALELNITFSQAEEKMLPQYLEKCLNSPDDAVKKAAEEIVKKFGQRLAVIFMTLKKGEPENQKKRPDWTEAHWNFWKTIETVILAGGLASSFIGLRLKYYYDQTLKEFGQDGYQIVLGNDSVNAAIHGCASHLTLDEGLNQYIILDYGQTFIKRSVLTIMNERIICMDSLEKKLSRYVDWIVDDAELEFVEAKALHQYMIRVLADTIEETKKKENPVSCQFVLSVANYVKSGKFAYRGGYGKLSILTDNYEDYFQNELQEILKRPVKVLFLHDGTAMAHGYPGYQNAVCISLGTAFGVGFPESGQKKIFSN